MPFLVRVPGIVQVFKSSESSAQVIPATSSRRCPVSIKMRTMAPKGRAASPAARHTGSGFFIAQNAVPFVVMVVRGNSANGLFGTVPRFIPQAKQARP